MTDRHLFRTDTHPHPQVTVRRWEDNNGFVRADVFVGGWRVATYRTERALAARVEREVAACDAGH
jgi:hypothetical protein